VVTDKKSALHWQRRETILQRLLLAALVLGAASSAFSQAPNPTTTSASTTIANLRFLVGGSIFAVGVGAGIAALANAASEAEIGEIEQDAAVAVLDPAA